MNSTKKDYKRPIVMLVVTILFSVLTFVVDRKPIGYDGTSVGFSSINGFFAGSFGYNPVMDTLSDIAMYLSFLVVAAFALIGAVQLIKGKSLSKYIRSSFRSVIAKMTQVSGMNSHTWR